MIITQDKKRVVQSHDFDEVNCTIDAEDMRYVASLLRNNYSNPSLAVIREITANAIDANKEAKATRRVEVKLPSSMNPTFCVRDYGSGLSQGAVFGIYSKYGKSTKRTSNSYIGAFGIGKFAPLSYGDNFSVVSYHGGERKTYNVYVTEQDDTKISLMEQVPSKEPSGLEVQVAVADNDIQRFKRECLKFFEHFEDNRMPILKGLGDDRINPLKKTLEGDNWFMAETDSSNYYQSHNQSYAIMGGVAYPVNSHSINFDNIEENKNNHLHQLLSHDGLYMNFDLGELKLHHSRESLEYSKGTQAVLIKKVIKIKSELSEIAREKLSNSNDFWEAKRNYARIINSLPRQIRGVLESHFTWKGHKVDSFSFNQVWEDGQNRWRNKSGDADMYINHYTKQVNEALSDGFKVLNKRESTIYVGDNTRVAVNDCDNSSQLALRIRTIFKENEDVDEVYVLRFTTKLIKKKFYTDQQFELVDKDFVYSLRKVEKAKVKGRMGSSTSSSGGSTRQNIKLFKFNPSAVYEIGAGSMWDDVKDSPDDEALYVPIFNYKIVDEKSIGNSSVTEEKISPRNLKGIMSALKLHKVDVPTIYGVRRKDCSKLDDNFKCAFKWIVSKSKELLKDDTLYEKQALLSSIKEKKDWIDYHDFGNIITNKHFVNYAVKKRGMKGEIVQFYNTCKQEEELSEEVGKYHNLIEFVEGQTGKDNYSKRMEEKADSKELHKLFNSITEKYGLLTEIQFYGYSESPKQFDKIIEYIKMCDSIASQK